MSLERLFKTPNSGLVQKPRHFGPTLSNMHRQVHRVSTTYNALKAAENERMRLENRVFRLERPIEFPNTRGNINSIRAQLTRAHKKESGLLLEYMKLVRRSIGNKSANLRSTVLSRAEKAAFKAFVNAVKNKVALRRTTKRLELPLNMQRYIRNIGEP